MLEVGQYCIGESFFYIWAHLSTLRVDRPGYPLQFLSPLRGLAGFPLLSLARNIPRPLVKIHSLIIYCVPDAGE
jgi:hypothetical protein